MGKSFTTNQWLSQFGFLCSDDSGKVFSLGIEGMWAVGWDVMATKKLALLWVTELNPPGGCWELVPQMHTTYPGYLNTCLASDRLLPTGY